MDKNYIQIDLGEIKNSCFIVMPFSDLYQAEYQKVIIPAIEELGILPIRGDEIYGNQRIMDDIWKSLKECRFVLAELTGRNPNVLYEVGLAHAIGKPIIIITRNPEDVPFDLKDLRYIFYNINDPLWGENLKNAIQTLIRKMIESKDFGDYLKGVKLIGDLDYPKVKNTEKELLKSIPQRIHDISGNWKGRFLMDKIKYDVILHIVQNGINLTGTATISFNDEKLTVIQEIFNGTIKGKSIVLTGVNYTFIERGLSEDYALEVFRLNYTLSPKLLTGDVRNLVWEEGDEPSKIQFQKA